LLGSLQLPAAHGPMSLLWAETQPSQARSAHPAWHLPSAQMLQEPPAWSTRERHLRPFTLPRSPLPRAPSKHRAFLTEQTNDMQAHRQSLTHTHPSETASRCKFVSRSQNHSTCEKPGPEEGTGGPVSGDTEPERDEGSETDSKMERERQTLVCTHKHAHIHTHTHTHREA